MTNLSVPEDKTVLYLIVRESLGMSPGKTAAQVGHAVEKVMLRYLNLFKAQLLSRVGSGHSLLQEQEEADMTLVTEWIHHASCKIVKAANESQWAALKEEFGPRGFLVRDNGRTELEPDTETVICTLPVRKSTVSLLVRKLPLLR